MKILITPKDIADRCLWDSYAYYIVGSEKEAERILKENEEFELSERDALIIGLLKVIETNNFIHKFNDYFIHSLGVKSTKIEGDHVIKLKSLLSIIEKFKEKFPEYYVPGAFYDNSLKDVNVYMDNILKNIDKLDILKLTDKTGTYDFLTVNSVKKLLSFHNY